MLTREWLQAFVPLGVVPSPGQWRAIGAGVLFVHHELLWLITARHVLRAGRDQIAPLLATTADRVAVLDLESIQNDTALSWIEREDTDIAVTLLPIFPEARIKALSVKECITLDDVVPSMRTYTVGCPYGVPGVDPSRPQPLILDGVVSGVSEAERVIFTSAPTFPGNSGGPLLVVRSPVNPSGGVVIGRPTVLFAGIMLQTALVRAPRTDEGLPPLHLGIARTADDVITLLESSEALTQVRKAKSANPA